MLRVSKLADYGTVVMVFLAGRQDVLSSARDIAARTHVSLPTVSKVLKQLTAAGLLRSARGASGGYCLNKPPASISVAHILYALDESRGLTECSDESSTCALQRVCHVQNNWRLISQAIEAALESVSLEALAAPMIASENLNQMKQVMMGVGHVERA
jgi:FeS assembly SUF system regulator